MSAQSLQDLRDEAKRLHIPWSAVRSLAQHFKSEEWESRQYLNDVRSTAWCIATAGTPGSWPFWRHGFNSRWGARVERSDFTAVPGYDTIAQEVSWSFPEYSDSDGTERLWAFLFAPYNRMPPFEVFWARALETLKTAPPEPAQRDETPIPF
jgi:hypothetical protein